MRLPVSLKPEELLSHLLHVAVVSPVFVWGPPGIGKSSLVRSFAESVGMECVSLLGSQLASEDLVGVPRIDGDVSRFCPPAMIARKEPYVLFLDELNASSVEVQKAFYSLVLERRVGSYTLPEGSVVIGAGNRMEDGAIVKPMPSALINRFSHVALEPDAAQWLAWAGREGLHEQVVEYIRARPDHLWEAPPKDERPFATPRSWEFLSNEIKSYGDALSDPMARALAFGRLSEGRAQSFLAWRKIANDRHKLERILKGEASWPSDPADRDLLYFLARGLNARLVRELPQSQSACSADVRELASRAKKALVDLARVSEEMAKACVGKDDSGAALPAWFLVEISRDLPRLAEI